ncbi:MULTISPECIES: thioredoxin family protein [unclassified Myroides]|uniref:thioredoxin family protein n=1 Tax=unclassified Myroides TaxID=2642485 RepID=UPI003D2F5507
MKQLTFYHAGCPVCVSAEQDLLNLIADHPIEIVHLGEEKAKVQEAERAGVQSVPALVLANGNVLHINFGASIADLK